MTRAESGQPAPPGARGMVSVGRYHLVVVLLLVLAALAGGWLGGRLGPMAQAQSDSPPQAAAAGLPRGEQVRAIPVNIGRDRSGVVMYDTASSSLWAYELVDAGADKPCALQLFAARSFAYDRLLTNYNNMGLQPNEVRDLVKRAGDPVAAEQGKGTRPGQGAGAPGAGSEFSGATVPAETARVIDMLPVQIDRDRFGLAMTDSREGTVWVYEFVTTNPRIPNAMRLFAARTFRYDRWLEDRGNLPPVPTDVLELVNRQRSTPPKP